MVQRISKFWWLSSTICSISCISDQAKYNQSICYFRNINYALIKRFNNLHGTKRFSTLMVNIDDWTQLMSHSSRIYIQSIKIDLQINWEICIFIKKWSTIWRNYHYLWYITSQSIAISIINNLIDRNIVEFTKFLLNS